LGEVVYGGGYIWEREYMGVGVFRRGYVWQRGYIGGGAEIYN